MTAIGGRTVNNSWKEHRDYDNKLFDIFVSNGDLYFCSYKLVLTRLPLKFVASHIGFKYLCPILGKDLLSLSL